MIHCNQCSIVHSSNESNIVALSAQKLDDRLASSIADSTQVMQYSLSICEGFLCSHVKLHSLEIVLLQRPPDVYEMLRLGNQLLFKWMDNNVRCIS